jgi:hypothetical protein
MTGLGHKLLVGSSPVSDERAAFDGAALFGRARKASSPENQAEEMAEAPSAFTNLLRFIPSMSEVFVDVVFTGNPF